MSGTDNPGAWVTTIVRDFIRESPANTLRNRANERAWGEPLVGFSRGDDPMYEKYKEVVAPSHWTPEEIFALTFPETAVKPNELSVVCWILPQTLVTKANNRKQTIYPAERWARARIFGEEVNRKLRQHVVDVLREEGYQAVAPMLSPQWERVESDRYVYSSTWSERHAAYASGLGTFGLCDGLITPVGKAMRVGSVVARIQIPPTPRPYQDHRAYCLFFAQGTCGDCISPMDAGSPPQSRESKPKASSEDSMKYNSTRILSWPSEE